MSINWLAGKSVLITGASGTIGNALVNEVLAMRPSVVRALDSHEHGLFGLQQQVGEKEEVRWLLGDIRDRQRLQRAMEGIDVVFHTAALKHVALGEYNPFEVVQTNLIGLQNVITGALENNVERVIFTSSDKAVNPTNTMGASKLMGERLVSAAQQMRGKSRTTFASVRFGNVVGSNGSVTTIFRQQISQGGPITLTDRRMTRFVMGLDQAVRLVLRAGELCTGGELFVMKMHALRIADLADVMIESLAQTYGYRPGEIGTVEIGCRPGEKLYEELLMEAELNNSYEDDEFIIFLGKQADDPNVPLYPHLGAMRPVTAPYHSDLTRHMTKAEIETFLVELGILRCPEIAEVHG
ncbi:MAG: SDR family NAD(P)-dependent oxidoreductase [Blastocatellia bacterium]